MTNGELSELLQKVIDAPELDLITIAALMDAVIHAAQKLHIPLQEAAASFSLLAYGHEVVQTLFGPGELLGATQPATQEEKDKLNSILGDLHIDL